MACELLPCGHCQTLLVDDHCGLSEHRYCLMCDEGPCNNELQETINTLFKMNQKLEEEKTHCAGCMQKKTDVLPYCFDCYMAT